MTVDGLVCLVAVGVFANAGVFGANARRFQGRGLSQRLLQHSGRALSVVRPANKTNAVAEVRGLSGIVLPSVFEAFAAKSTMQPFM